MAGRRDEPQRPTLEQLRRLVHTDGVSIDTVHCPVWNSRRLWSEIGPGDQPGHTSIHLHCNDCPWSLKQDVSDEPVQDGSLLDGGHDQDVA
jgi:hypothetical protein